MAIRKMDAQFCAAQQFAGTTKLINKHNVFRRTRGQTKRRKTFVCKHFPRNSRSNYVMCGSFSHCNSVLEHVVMVLMQTNINTKVIILVSGYFSWIVSRRLECIQQRKKTPRLMLVKNMRIYLLKIVKSLVHISPRPTFDALPSV